MIETIFCKNLLDLYLSMTHDYLITLRDGIYDPYHSVAQAHNRDVFASLLGADMFTENSVIENSAVIQRQIILSVSLLLHSEARPHTSTWPCVKVPPCQISFECSMAYFPLCSACVRVHVCSSAPPLVEQTQRPAALYTDIEQTEIKVERQKVGPNSHPSCCCWLGATIPPPKLWDPETSWTK